MGQSTDAILVWGFDLEGEDDFDKKLDERIKYLNDEGYNELQALEKSTGAELVRHCSCDCPMYVVGVTSTKVQAYRGHPKEITSLDLDAAEGQLALKRFAEALGVAPKEGRWILASDWC